MTDVLDRNKEIVTAFYDLMFNQCRPREAIERHSGAEYRAVPSLRAIWSSCTVAEPGPGTWTTPASTSSDWRTARSSSTGTSSR